MIQRYLRNASFLLKTLISLITNRVWFSIQRLKSYHFFFSYHRCLLWFLIYLKRIWSTFLPSIRLSRLSPSLSGACWLQRYLWWAFQIFACKIEGLIVSKRDAVVTWCVETWKVCEHRWFSSICDHWIRSSCHLCIVSFSWKLSFLLFIRMHQPICYCNLFLIKLQCFFITIVNKNQCCINSAIIFPSVLPMTLWYNWMRLLSL